MQVGDRYKDTIIDEDGNEVIGVFEVIEVRPQEDGPVVTMAELVETKPAQ